MINMPGGPEIMVILLLALLVLGPDQLPKAMRTFGNVMAEIRKVSSSFQAEMRDALDVIETAATDDERAEPTTKTGSVAIDSTATEAGRVPEVDGVSPGGPVTDATGVVADPERSDGGGRDALEGAEEPKRPRIDPADRAAG